ncbi:uncharacterized protein LOC118241444 isoform X2 [Electrophorus electricus]|uniref:uncharacterized protein LOC118241444 isoform X2 n=1 Tax=Electrophorus electricus TaxID=8005 RepID=UPI0015D067B6|nr:uncharacterized protein LOC118241444 isoform X2 [Electrophorus electricus]
MTDFLAGESLRSALRPSALGPTWYSMTNHHRMPGPSAKDRLPSGRCVGTPALLPGSQQIGERTVTGVYVHPGSGGVHPQEFLGGGLEPGPRKTEMHHNNQKEGSWVDPSGSPVGRAEAHVPSLQWTHQRDWRGLPKAQEANRRWDAPRVAGEWRTVGAGSMSGTGVDVHPRMSIEAPDTYKA